MKKVPQYIVRWAGMLAQNARWDKSVPKWDESWNEFYGWRTKELLDRIDYELHCRGNCAAEKALVKICDRALQELALLEGVEPAVPAIITLKKLKGTQWTTPFTPDLEARAHRIIIDIKGMIIRLPADTRREQCLQSHFRQSGEFYDACGRFDLSAETIDCLAQFAEEHGDTSKAAILRFIAITRRARHAFCIGKGIDGAVRAIISAIPALQTAVRDTKLAVEWGIGNAYINVLLALIWDNHNFRASALPPDITLWGRFAFLLLGQTPLIVSAFNDHVALVQASDAAAKDELGCITETELGKLTISKSPEVSATALLVLGRLTRNNDPGRAREYYNQIPKTSNVSHIRAIADRELAALDS